MTEGLRVEVEINLAGHPLVAEFGEQGEPYCLIPMTILSKKLVTVITI